MQILSVKAYPIKISKATVFNFTYVTLATSQGVLITKVMGNFSNYKYSSYFDFCHTFDLLLVKSNKNWIIKEFNNPYQVLQPKNYQDYELIAKSLRYMYLNFIKIDDNFLPLLDEVFDNFFDKNIDELEAQIDRFTI
jgi:hypothetical protein